METQRLLTKLASRVRDDDFLATCEEVIDELARQADAAGSVEGLLRLMEENEDVDFGSPGPIVHFVESFFRRGYEEKLVDSLRRRPTAHTLWMLNRLINGLSKGERQPMLDLLKDISASSTDEAIKSEAAHYCRLHE